MTVKSTFAGMLNPESPLAPRRENEDDQSRAPGQTLRPRPRRDERPEQEERNYWARYYSSER